MQVTIGNLLDYAIINHADLLSIVNFTGLVRRARVRQRQVEVNGAHTIAKYGQVLADVPAIIAQNLQRPHDERDLLVLIHIPREVADEAYEFLTSPIISPNGHHGNLIVPP